MHLKTNKKFTKVLVVAILVVGVFVSAQIAQAATGINKQINYQGKLTNELGVSVANGNYNMKISLYTVSSGGTPVWTARGTAAVPTARTVTVTNGIFSIMLGDTVAGDNIISIPLDQDAYYLGITVAADTEMTPRKRIGAVPQAFNANSLVGDGYVKVTGAPTGNAVDAGTVYVNPASATAGYTLLGLAVGGVQKLKVDEAGNLTNSGTFTLGSLGTQNTNALLCRNSSNQLAACNTIGVAQGGTGTATAFTQGSIVFAGASGIYSQDNANFFWNNTNKRLGIGTATPGFTLDINGASGVSDLFRVSANGSALFTVTEAQSTFNNPVAFQSVGDVSIANDLNMTNSTAGNINFDGPGYIRTQSGWQNLDLTFSAANSGSVVVDDNFVAIGNVGIGITDPGAYKLNVNGNTNITGTLTTSGGATIQGLIVDHATATYDRILTTVAATGAARFDGTITNADLTAARTWTLPNVTGTVITTGDSGTVSTTMLANNSVNGSKIALGSDATGDIMYYNGTDYVRLAGVVAGNSLISGGVGTAPSWGKIALGTHTTGSYVATEADTLATVTGRGASTTTQLGFNYNSGSPFTVLNSTLVSNLNVDMLDGQHASAFQLALTNPVTGTGTNGYNAYWTGTGTIGSEQYTAVSRGGTGAGTFTSGGVLFGNGTSAVTASAVMTNGQLLIGDGSGAPTLATLTGTTNQVNIANGAGSITLSLPQNIHTGATPTFAGLTLNDGTSDLMTVSSTQAFFNVPTSFTSSGDISLAYDMLFTNQTASNIKTNSPFTIEVGEPFESNDLTLRTFNAGGLVLDAPGGLTSMQAQVWNLATSTSALNIGGGLINVDTTNGRVGVGTTSPGAKLDIVSNAGIPIRITNDNYNDWVLQKRRSDDSQLFGIRESNSDGSMSFVTANSTRMTIANGGNVGIGTATPGAPLEVSSTANPGVIIGNGTTGYLKVGSSGWYDDGSYLSPMGTRNFYIRSTAPATYIYSPSIYLGSTSGTSVSLRGNNINGNNFAIPNSGLTYFNSGNVGIGTTSPSDKLEVYGTIRASDAGSPGYSAYIKGTALEQNALEIGIGAVGSTHKLITSGNYYFGTELRFWTSDTQQMTINNIGNVGIGITAPGAYKLNVNGDTNITGNLAITGTVDGVDISTYSPYFINAAGTNGQVWTSDGSGAGNWTTAASGMPSGTEGQTLYNNAGTWTASSGTFWDDTNNRLGIGTTAPAASLSILGATNALRLSYDAANYATFSTTSTGLLQFNTSAATESSVIVGTGGAQDTSLIFDGASTDFYAGLDDTDSVFKIGTGQVVGTSPLLYLSTSGKFGIGVNPATYRFQVDWNGDGANYAYVNNSNAWTNGSADYAEYFYTNDSDLASGESVCIDTNQQNAVKRCARSEDPDLMGIVSTSPSVLGNAPAGRENDPHYVIVAMLGQIPAKTSDENGAIAIGDALTSASKPGYIMKANAGDSTVGVALEPLKSGEGNIQVLISRKNQSLTVEKVEEAVTQHIASMDVEDQVNKMVADAQLQLTQSITSQSVIVADLQSQIENQSDVMLQLTEQMDLIRQQNQALIDFTLALNVESLIYKDVLGNLDLLDGKLIASEIVAGTFTVGISDPDAKTIGEATIKTIVDADSDGLDDATGVDGKNVEVLTTKVSQSCKIFTNFENNPGAYSWIEKVENTSGEGYSGFRIMLDKSAAQDVKVNWWIVESE